MAAGQNCEASLALPVIGKESRPFEK